MTQETYFTLLAADALRWTFVTAGRSDQVSALVSAQNARKAHAGSLPLAA